MRALLTAMACCLSLGPAHAMDAIEIPIVYLTQEQDLPPVLSNLEERPEDLGLAGAVVGLKDNQTTGRFLGHNYSLTDMSVPVGGDLAEAARQALALSPLLVVDAPPAALLAIADLPEAQGAVIFNTAAPDPDLRSANCRANLLHTAPSLTMRADALMQFARAKRWTKLALIAGTHPGDIAYAQALRASAQRFGLKIRAEKTWAFDADMRRNAAQEVPLFTQDLPDHDLLLIADELHDFGRYVAYNTWTPRPTAGSEGLTATAWAPVVEQWGAAQLQSRFVKSADRPMQSQDYAAWAAVRALGEAVTRTGTADAATLRAFLLSKDFELAGFKGRPLSFRDWNGQLRQPIPLTTARAMVAQAPLPGYLHERTELDTLGPDRPETQCEAFQ